MADPLPPNPFPFLTPSYAGGRNSICRADTPYPSVSHESVPSQIDNLTNALYGAITKTVQNGRVIWNIPCDPTTSPSTILGVSRNTNEGLLCYITRALNTAVPNAFVTIDGIQTLTNKTLTAPIINSPTINNLTATGTLSLPSGSITTSMIANGSIIDIDISASAAIANSKLAGNPVSTNTASTIVLRDGSGNFSAGTITASLSGTSTTSTNVLGTTTNDNAAAGYVGEFVNSTVSVGSAISLTSGTTANVTSISLTAGDWDVRGQVDYRAGATTSITILKQGISTTSATLGAQDTFTTNVFAAVVPTASNDIGNTFRQQRISLASTTTIYLVSNATFTPSTLSAYGTITARRVR